MRKINEWTCDNCGAIATFGEDSASRPNNWSRLIPHMGAQLDLCSPACMSELAGRVTNTVPCPMLGCVDDRCSMTPLGYRHKMLA